MADLTVTAGSVLFTSGTKTTGVAGAAITAGQGLYLDAATNTLKLAVSTSAAPADAVGIALHAAGSGQPVTYAANGSLINIGATTSKATTYMVSAGAAGGVAPQADLVSTNKIVRLGYATATDGSFVVDIRNTGVAV